MQDRRRTTAARRAVARLTIGTLAAGAVLLAPVGAVASGPSTTATATAAADGFVTRIPRRFDLPSQGERGWRPNRHDDGTWVLTPCLTAGGDPVTEHSSDRARRDFRSLRMTAPEHVGWQQLGLFRDGRSAQAALRELRRDLRRCDHTVTVDRHGYRHEMTWASRNARVKGVHAGFHAYGDYEAFDPRGERSYGLGGPFVTVVRVRNAVYLVGFDGETDFARERNVRRAARSASREVAAFAPQLRRLVLGRRCRGRPPTT
jgi:hypothetical protein